MNDIKRYIFVAFIMIISGIILKANAQSTYCILPSELSNSKNASISSVSGADLHFPASGTINALIVFVQMKDDHYEDYRQLTGYDNLGQPLWDPSISYDTSRYSQSDPVDSWQINGYQSWTDDEATEWRVNLPDGPNDPNSRVNCRSHPVPLLIHLMIQLSLRDH